MLVVGVIGTFCYLTSCAVIPASFTTKCGRV